MDFSEDYRKQFSLFYNKYDEYLTPLFQQDGARALYGLLGNDPKNAQKQGFIEWCGRGASIFQSQYITEIKDGGIIDRLKDSLVDYPGLEMTISRIISRLESAVSEIDDPSYNNALLKMRVCSQGSPEYNQSLTDLFTAAVGVSKKSDSDPYEFLMKKYGTDLTMDHVRPLLKVDSVLSATREESDLMKLFYSEFPADQDTMRKFLNEWKVSLRTFLPLKKFVGDIDFDWGDSNFINPAHPQFINISVKYVPGNFVKTLISFSHEYAHALYSSELFDQTLPAWHPVQDYYSVTTQEATAMFIDRYILRNDAIPLLVEMINRYFGPDIKVDEESLWRVFNNPNPNASRVFCDEISYVGILKSLIQIEFSVFHGNLDPKEIPEVLSELVRANIGEVSYWQIPESDRNKFHEKVVHWKEGMFGYLPSYLLGDSLAANMYKQFREKDGILINTLFDGGQMIDPGAIYTSTNDRNFFNYVLAKKKKMEREF
jgi:hypothetical protein